MTRLENGSRDPGQACVMPTEAQAAAVEVQVLDALLINGVFKKVLAVHWGDEGHCINL